MKSIRSDVDETQKQNESLVTQLPSGMLFCNVCQLECSGKICMDAHLIGKTHRKKLNMFSGFQQIRATLIASKEPPVMVNSFRCDICNIQTTDLNGLEMHKVGKKHMKKLQMAR